MHFLVVYILYIITHCASGYTVGAVMAQRFSVRTMRKQSIQHGENKWTLRKRIEMQSKSGFEMNIVKNFRNGKHKAAKTIGGWEYIYTNWDNATGWIETVAIIQQQS